MGKQQGTVNRETIHTHKKNKNKSQFLILSNLTSFLVKINNGRKLYLHPSPVSSAGLKQLLATAMLFTDCGDYILYTV